MTTQTAAGPGQSGPPTWRTRLAKLGRKMWFYRYLYLLALPGVLYFLVFSYLPMWGVVIAFKDYATALACYDSPEYQAAKSLRVNASVGDLVIIDGYDGPQPA